MKPRSVTRIIVAIVATVVVVVGAGLFATRAVVRGAARLFETNTAPCDGLGHASTPSRLIWDTQTVTGNLSQADFAVSNPIAIPSGSRGIRVDAKVYGTRSAPIFPDPVGLEVVGDAQLHAALQQDVDKSQLPAPSARSGEAPLLTSVGFGIKAINRDIALPPGIYRLVSAAGVSRLGDVDVRVCS